MTINDICQSFDINGSYISCKEISTGIINSTYYVRYLENGVRKNYILQRINKAVFSEPEKVMDNIVRVTEFIHAKVEKRGLPVDKVVLKVFLSKNSKRPYIIDNFGDYWRCYLFIENSITYNSSDDLTIIKNVGMAFGRFQRWINGFDAKSLYIPIPNFHNTPKRYLDFEKAVKADKYGRVSEVKNEIKDIMSFKAKASRVQLLLENGDIPYRVTHNDTKCNNVCFDESSNEPLAVLDLDTVMPGAIAFDFGDAIRSIASTLEEDNPDIQNVFIDLDKFEAFVKGFVPEVKDKLNSVEKSTLNDGVFTLTVELAMRFLTDYIEGDKYFKIKYPGHNLDRARNQIALAKDILIKKTEMDGILDKYLRS